MTGNAGKQHIAVFGRSHFVGVVLLIVVVLGLVVDADKTDNDNFYSDIIRLDNVATKIHQSYVEEVGSEELIDKAVNGMIEILDPHTSFFKRKQYEELRIHTEGKFGGLGIQISIRDKILTVMTPISGTPASRSGIRSGDQIVKIDGKSTKGITIEKAVAKLRGEPGSDVTITIRRKGESNDLDYTITRQIITIKSVPYYGMLDGDVGYVRLTTFSQEAGDEVEKAINALLPQKPKGVVLDLRHNPGGLLPQAIEVSEKFLNRKSLVVSTRGRLRGQNKEFYAGANPVLPEDVSLVVLVDPASASASEIVAGAIQDWDRGVVLGDTTFGKGSVQSILPIDKDHHLKLTTAFYYTPSGRCINKAENGIRGKDDENGDGEGESAEEEDTTAANDSSYVDTTVYTTKAGRVVYGGGGIIPDTIVELDPPAPAVRSLLFKDVFFKFANAEYPRLKKEMLVIDSSFQPSDTIMKRFKAFLDSIEFEFKTYPEVKFEEFRDKAGLIDSTSDSTDGWFEKPRWSKEERADLDALVEKMNRLLKKQEEREFASSMDEVTRHVREALLVRELGQDHPVVYREKLSADKQVLQAADIISNQTAYESILSPKK